MFDIEAAKRESIMINVDGLLCPKRKRYYSRDSEDYFRVELIKYLIDKKNYSADMIYLDYKINVGSGDKHIKADVVVIQEGRYLLVAEVKHSPTDRERERAIKNQLIPAARLLELEQGIYWDSSDKFFIPDINKNNDRLDINRIPYRFIEDFTLEGAEGKEITSGDLRPITMTHNIPHLIKVIIRNTAGNVSSELASQEVFKFLLCKYYDEVSHAKEGDIMEMQVKNGEGAGELKNRMESFLNESLLYYSNKCESLRNHSREFNLSAKCISALVTRFQESSLQRSPGSVIQDVFMHFAPQQLKAEFQQFYTPETLVDFAASILDITNTSTVIDPASGSADFMTSVIKQANKKLPEGAKHVKSNVHAWDISSAAVNVAALNMILHGDGLSSVKKRDSIKEFEEMNGRFNFVLTNPPFGKNTKEKDEKILERYSLYREFQYSELGTLFIERSYFLLKEQGILVIIVPVSYLTLPTYTNLRSWLFRHYRMLGAVYLPGDTFTFAGASPNTAVLILQKDILADDYPIFLFEAETIGYNITSKKMNPIYLRDPLNGSLCRGEDEEPMLLDDLILCREKIMQFAKDNNINGLYKNTREGGEYTSVTKEEIFKDADKRLPIQRLTKRYKTEMSKGNKCISAIAKIQRGSAIDKRNSAHYHYVNTGAAKRGFYKPIITSGWNLPGRARRFKVEKGDIFIATQNGHTNFAIIMKEETSLFSSGFIQVKVAKPYRNQFIAFLLSDRWYYLSSCISEGSTQKDFNIEYFKRIMIETDIEQSENLRIESLLDNIAKDGCHPIKDSLERKMGDFCKALGI